MVYSFGKNICILCQTASQACRYVSRWAYEEAGPKKESENQPHIGIASGFLERHSIL
jgi:hypothetical protein